MAVAVTETETETETEAAPGWEIQEAMRAAHAGADKQLLVPNLLLGRTESAREKPGRVLQPVSSSGPRERRGQGLFRMQAAL